ncbi:MAG: helix-turn-helix domain-containing protein [Anaerolineales bacterium]
MAVKDTSNSTSDKITGKLLSPEERQACELISSGEGLSSQRAQALLAIDEGATQAAAGEGAGLTSGQVKYWLAQFRKGGMEVFPEISLVEADPEPEPAVPEVKEAATKKEKKPKSEKKAKKAKKSKKKAKKSKGVKKSKKGKGAAAKSKKKSKKKKK